MAIDSATISIIAIVISVVSLFFSIYQSGVNWRLQWEQLCGECQARLTSRGVELLEMLDQLQSVSGSEAGDARGKLHRLIHEMIDLRGRIGKLTPPWCMKSVFTIQFTRIKCDLDDAEPIFDALKAAMSKVDCAKMSRVADGLLERFLGAKDNNAGVRP